jgi:hypothetical protein
MDLHEHGISAYPEYEISPFASPSGLATQNSTLGKNAGFPPPAMARSGIDKG